MNLIIEARAELAIPALAVFLGYVVIKTTPPPTHKKW